MRKNIFAVLLGFVLCAAVFGLLEGFFRLNAYFGWVSKMTTCQLAWNGPADPIKSQLLKKEIENLSIYQWRPKLSWEQDKVVIQEGFDRSHLGPLPTLPGKRPFATDLTFRSKVYSKMNRTLVYDASFAFDHVGRRVTPVSLNSSYNIVFLGDSYTLGEGVNDDQSYPFQLAKFRPAAQVYNLGASGNGPNDVLFEMMMPSSARFKDIAKRKTVVIYTYMDAHLERLICRSNCVYPDDWMLDKPYYALNDGKLEFRGRFNTDRLALNLFYYGITHLALVSFFDVILPPRFTDRHFELFGVTVAKMKAISKELFPDSQFFLAFYPGDSNSYGPRAKAAAIKQGIDVLSYFDIDVNAVTLNNSRLPADHHPSPVAHGLFAYLLNRDLPQ